MKLDLHERELWEQLRSGQQLPETVDVVQVLEVVDLLELMEPMPLRQRRTPSVWKPQAEGSIVGGVDKAAVLAMVEQLEAEENSQEQVWAIASDENVSRWIRAISLELEAVPSGQASFTQLCQSIGLSRVEVWLGLLLGEFELQPEGEFYGDVLWVKVKA